LGWGVSGVNVGVESCTIVFVGGALGCIISHSAQHNRQTDRQTDNILMTEADSIACSTNGLKHF